MKEFLTILSLFVVLNGAVLAQIDDHQVFQSPLDIPLFLSGNFGELRKGHFHAGIDFKTQSSIGKPVLATYQGYVSRIKIQSGGYGRSIYITHPNGYTTLYAHLDKYIPAIEQYVRHNQYLRKSYEVELFPSKGMFSFKQGEVIAYSGNSGRSGGPHLHYEIRKTAGQVPVNGLKYNFPVLDTIAPRFRKLYIYNDTARLTYPVKQINDTVFSVADTLEMQVNQIELATEVYDFLNGSGNKCGVYSLQLIIEHKPVYGFEIDQIPFSKTRYINAHMDYDLKLHKGKSVHRLFALPNNELSIYNHNYEADALNLLPDSVYSALIVAKDVYGNASTLYLLFKVHSPHKKEFILGLPGNRCNWISGGKYNIGNLNLTIPPRALYRNVELQLDIEQLGGIKDTFRIHLASEPLHKYIDMQVKLDSVQSNISDKLTFVRRNGNHAVESVESKFENGYLTTSIRDFGNYFILYDTVPPAVVPIKFRKGNYQVGDSISFKITDDITGVKRYNVYIDDEWALFSFDAKSDKLSYIFDGTSLLSATAKMHTIRIEVEDYKGNKGIYNNTFIF